jgi:hypothetical protein
MKKYLYLIASAIGFMLVAVACSNGGGSSSTTACTTNSAGCVYSQQYGWLSQGSCPVGYVQLPYSTGYATYPTAYNGAYNGAYGGQNCVLASQISSGYGYGTYGYGTTGYYQGGCPAGQALINGQCGLVNNGLVGTPYYNYPYYGGGYMYGYTGTGGCKTFWGGMGWYCY